MNQKGFIPIAVIVTIVIILAASGGAFFMYQKSATKPHETQSETVSEKMSGPMPSSLPPQSPTISIPPATARSSPAIAPPTAQKIIPQKTTPAPPHTEVPPRIPTPPPTTSASFRNAPELPSAAERNTLSDCASTVFSFAPVELNRLMNISPLGNLGPPGHTFPTEHMFFHITAGGVTTDTIPLYAPGDIHLTLIYFGRGFTQDTIDYTIWFAPCKDIVAYYNHVKELSPELEKIVAESPCAFSGESKETRCNVSTLTPIAKGMRIGQVGRLQGNFDMGLIDLRKTHVFANPDRYGMRSLHIECPLDYFDGNTASRLYALLSRSDKKCGTVAQDIPGTLKGNWFFENARADRSTDWHKYLAFVDDSERPDIAVISVGGTFAAAGKWEFSPQTSGQVNRTFADVKPDSATYCYESQKMSGRIIVRLESATELKIEYQQESCTQSFIFITPTTYKR
ncbi:MAG: hypothetical protein AAB604_02945 [Patescibacteria group bacterium]